MKILLINALKPYSRNSWLLKTLSKLFLPADLTLQYIASMTPKEHDVRILDESISQVKETDFSDNYDIIGISCNRTPAALHTYRIADEFRRRGKTVVLGGYHPSAMPEEAKQHADSVVIGEAELTWPQLLKDFENGKLKPFYRQNRPVDPNNIPPADHTVGNISSFAASVQSTRGCPIGCEFCSIASQRFGYLYRKRPIRQVIEEIASIPQKFIIFNDSSLSIDLEYIKSLFREMTELNKKFRCWMNINIPLSNDEFLKLASEAGCVAIEFGLESISQYTINTISKRTNKVKLYRDVIRKVHDYGIAVGGTFVFGFDTDTHNVFDETLRVLPSLDLDFPRFSILTPFPGTPLFKRLDEEGRIITKDWSQYDMTHVVFQPKQMTVEELQSGWEKVCNEIYVSITLIKRIFAANNLSMVSWLWRGMANTIEFLK